MLIKSIQNIVLNFLEIKYSKSIRKIKKNIHNIIFEVKHKSVQK